jgi:TrmH family RNA methyltransferase
MNTPEGRDASSSPDGAAPEPNPGAEAPPERTAPRPVDRAPAGEIALHSPYQDRIVIVLNRTQDVVNIATSLRAMMNMGFTRLRLVAPEDFNAWRIAGIAHGSEPLIEKIEFFDTLDEAVADCVMVLGTTARRRAATYIWSHPREAAPEILAYDADATRPVAIVFGREDTGMLNHELDRCDRILVVPTSALNSSLNLSQAVLLIGYELYLAATARETLPRPKRDAPPATALELQALFEQADAALGTLDFYKGKNPEAIMRTVRAIIRRADINGREAALLRAMAIEVQKVVDRPIFRDAIMRRRDDEKGRGDGVRDD